MKKITLSIFALIFAIAISKAQTTAMQFTGMDCNNKAVNLFADLDAGKAVILHFFMPSCGSCPPPAQKIQRMANGINQMYPGMVKGYAFPFQNATTCAYTSSWVTSNNLSSLYSPIDSGAAQVAYYGGFGMPTVVLLGGKDHKIMFSTLSFNTSDTTILKNKILSLLGGTNINKIQKPLFAYNVFPNPAVNDVVINIDLQESSDLKIDILDITGKQVASILNEKQNGNVTKHFNTTEIPAGYYFVRMVVNGETKLHKLNIIR